MTDIAQLTNVLRRPLITEKSYRLQEQGRYSFEVDPRANKGLIKQAVERLFGVDVVRVNVMWVKGKRKRLGPRWVQKPGYKKAIVTLKPGQKIPILEG
ncbi:MAG: 50S ribosomal protein L23 [Dehalococcoidia bacterium]|nr:50S ribosomal protein L23 [Dehalococcoidia bacterium]MDW8119309.1 50S ribosomal protein L23 [Chloroflexota bacterium]